MTAPASTNRLLRYFKSRFGSTDVHLQSPRSQDEVLSAIADKVAKPSVTARMTVTLGDPFVHGQVSGNRVTLTSRVGMRQTQGARMMGQVDAAADGGSQLSGRIEGMAPLGFFVGGFLVLSSIFLLLFAYAALNPQLSKPATPWWLVLIPLGLDLLALILVETFYAGRKEGVRGLQDWLKSQAEFTSSDTGSP